jgi:hypothetical protein
VSQYSGDRLGGDRRTPPVLAVRLDDRASEPLSLESASHNAIATLSTAGLNQAAVVQWLARHDVPLVASSRVTKDPSAPVLVRLPTIVLCADHRIERLARLYARSVDAPLHLAATPDQVRTTIDRFGLGHSVTIILLNDRLEESLCHAAGVAARRRGASYGFLTGFTPEHVAWLIVKSWTMLLRPFPPTIGFASWSFTDGDATVRTRSASDGATHQARARAPWTASAVTVMSVRAHGAPFDASLGEVVLCGHVTPRLPLERTRRAPSCFHDGVCFRMASTGTVPTERLEATDALPLVWYLDSCASIPLTGCAFGEGTSYVFGLIAGAAVGVVGPFLDLTTEGSLTRHCEAVLATGGTLGESVAAACNIERGEGFDKFLLIGSPDVRIAAQHRIEGQRQGQRIVYSVRGERQYAFRLAVPSDLELPVHVVGDDGERMWTTAECHFLAHGRDRDLIVTLAEPADVDGRLTVAGGLTTNQQLAEQTSHIVDNLRVLRRVPFVGASERPAIARCRLLARVLRDVVDAPQRLRCRADAAVLLAHLTSELDALHQAIALRFLEAVAAHDVNLDRVAADGVQLRPTERSNQRCPTCRCALYATSTRSRHRSSYARRWVQCPNCSGLSLTPDNSPLDIALPVADRDATGLSISLQIRNCSAFPARVTIAGLARKGSLDDALGPRALMLDSGELQRHTLRVPINATSPGVISYRLVFLCRGAVELLALKHVVAPDDAIVSFGETTSDLATMEPGGHQAPRG